MGKALHKTVAVSQSIQQTIRHHIPEYGRLYTPLWTTASHTYMHFNFADIDKNTVRSEHEVYPPIYSCTDTMIARRIIHRFKRWVVKSSLDIEEDAQGKFFLSQ
jgi:hypothetical protein